MTSCRQQQKANKLLDAIEKHGTVDRYDAIDEAGMDMRQYYANSFSGWFIHTYQDKLHYIEYNKATNTFTWCKKENSTTT